MSAIFGLFRFDRAPADSETLYQMRDASREWPGDVEGLHVDGRVALGCRLRYNTPEARYENCPVLDPASGLVLAAAARIDNRLELFDLLDIDPPERCRTPDGALILKAYLKWGSDCCEHLLGDWAFAMWDPHRQTLCLARDHHGNTSLYYHQNRRFIAFASSIKSLLAVSGIPRRPDALHIARYIVIWPGHGSNTSYADVKRLPPAHLLLATPDGTTSDRYWFLENAPEVRLGNDQEYIDCFLEIYSEAVHCRLRSCREVGATLSGGLDSGSTVAVASSEMRRQGKMLQAFSAVPRYNVDPDRTPGKIGDERPLIEATRRFVGNINVNYLDAADNTPLAGALRFLELHGDLSVNVNAYWIVGLLEAARSRGVGTLLTGQFGNATVSWNGDSRTFLREIVAACRWRDYWSELRAMCISDGLWPGIRRGILRPWLPLFWIRRLRQLQAGRQPWRRYSPIHPGFALAVRLDQRMEEAGHDPAFSGWSDSYAPRYAMIGPGSTTLGSRWSDVGAGFGIEVRDPTADKRVLEFCLGLPESQFYRRGESRSLVRRAFAEQLPPEVLLNTRRGRQAADLGHRVTESRSEILLALERVGSCSLARECLDLPYMRSVVDLVERDADKPVNLVGSVLLSLSYLVGE